MRSHEEEPEIQQNTFLAIVPMARLPVSEGADQEPVGALTRPGRIYVFRKGKLWREQVCDGRGALADVDVSYWRSQSAVGQPCDDRAPVGKPLALTLVPVLLQGRYVGDQIDMAYSEMPWSWEYISWLEADSSRVKARCHERSARLDSSRGRQGTLATDSCDARRAGRCTGKRPAPSRPAPRVPAKQSRHLYARTAGA
ncbi:hypothetical protein ULF88_19880 [Halopseudomonas pachastrellae]|nr:hypothetical protein [Halopseudomonas pachastrellae]